MEPTKLAITGIEIDLLHPSSKHPAAGNAGQGATDNRARKTHVDERGAITPAAQSPEHQAERHAEAEDISHQFREIIALCLECAGQIRGDHLRAGHDGEPEQKSVGQSPQEPRAAV